MKKVLVNEKVVFANGLKRFLERCKLNEKNIAKECSISLPLVYNWLNGKNIPTYKSLQKLFELGMNEHEMFMCPSSGTDNENRFIENQNQYTLDELQQSLVFSQRRFLINMIKSGVQNAFNDLPKKEKISFLCRSVDERIAELDELNQIIKELSKD